MQKGVFSAPDIPNVPHVPHAPHATNVRVDGEDDMREPRPSFPLHDALRVVRVAHLGPVGLRPMVQENLEVGRPLGDLAVPVVERGVGDDDQVRPRLGDAGLHTWVGGQVQVTGTGT